MNRIRHRNPFTAIPNELLNCHTLSFKAKGIYSYLMSKPDGWVFYNDAILKETKDGLSSFQSGIKELVTTGWLKKSQIILENGQFGGIDYELATSQPLIKNTSTVTHKKDKIVKDLPSTENPSTENRPTYKEISNKEKNNTLKSIKKNTQGNKNIFKNIMGLEDIDHVHITIEQYNTLVTRYSIDTVHQKIKALEDWQLNKPQKQKKKDHYSTLNNWCTISFNPTQNKKYETATEFNQRLLKEEMQKALVEGNGVIDPEDFTPF